MLNLLLLLLAVCACGVSSLAMKPTNLRCTSKTDTILFNGCVTLVAATCAFVAFAAQDGIGVPPEGLLWAAVFGVVFSVTIFTNLLALEHGPLSLTTLIVNFSLVLTLLYSFLFFHETITAVRIGGIVILVGCMFLYTNPKISEADKSGSGSMAKWFGFALTAFVGNGLLSIIQKTYAVQTDNQYAASFLACGYLFATVTSAILFVILYTRQKKEDLTKLKAFFAPVMIGLILLTGFSNYILNLIVVLLATRMDAAIVYPVIQGGGPIFVTIGSKLLFGEKITSAKATAILLGCLAIVMLNL